MACSKQYTRAVFLKENKQHYAQAKIHNYLILSVSKGQLDFHSSDDIAEMYRNPKDLGLLINTASPGSLITATL